MPPSPEKNKREFDNELFELFDRALAGLATDEDAKRLENCLTEFEQYRAMYRNVAAMHADLAGAARRSRGRQAIYDEIRDRAAGGLDQPNTTRADSMPSTIGTSDHNRERRSGRVFKSIRGWVWLAVAATILTALFVGDSLRRRGANPADHQRSAEQLAQNQQTGSEFEPRRIIAFLKRADAVVWQERADAYEVNAVLSGGDEIRTESGDLEIEFVDGARVTLSGKSRFVLKHELLGYLYSGRLSANVPPRASGFTVATPQFRAIDHGTSFTLAVGEDGSAGAVVLSGAVDIDRRHMDTEQEETKYVRLRTGQGLWVERGHMTSDKQDPRIQTIVKQAPPISPMLGEAVASYREDFLVGTRGQPNTSTGWKYLYNPSSSFGDPSGYRDLLWHDKLLYACNGTAAFPGEYPHPWLNLRAEGGHPGCGVKQPDVDHDLFAIAAFEVPRDGRYRLDSAWIKTRDLELWQIGLPRSIEVAAHVSGRQVSHRTVMGFTGFANFDCELGPLRAGEMIYVGVGPNGDGARDTFDWDFTIVADLEGVAP